MSKHVERARAMRKAMTPPELALWLQLRALRREGCHFRRQAPEGPYFLDFLCKRSKLVIEVDGAHHGDGVQPEHDRVRDAYLEQQGFRVLRFWASEVVESLDDVMRQIRSAVSLQGDAPLSDASSPHLHEGVRHRRLVRLGLRRRD